MLALIEAPILFLFQSLVKQMFVVIAEADPQRSSIYNPYKCWTNVMYIFLFYTF